MSPTSVQDAVRPAIDWLKLPSHWPSQMELLSWTQQMGAGTAALLVLLGVVYLLFGYYLFKALVVLNLAAVGVVAGALIGDRMNAPLPGAILGGFVLAAVTIPLIRWGVALIGATIGIIIGGSVWRGVGLDPSYVWAGAMTGMVFCGLMCFILFRGCVVAYTCLQGSAMLVFGILGLIYKYEQAAPKLSGTLGAKPYLLSMSLFVCAVLGAMYQQHFQNAAAAQKK